MVMFHYKLLSFQIDWLDSFIVYFVIIFPFTLILLLLLLLFDFLTENDFHFSE